MKCIILAAGRGTRMGELTEKTQKVMLKVDGKPKLAWSIENLPNLIDEVVLIVGYRKEQIMDFFGESYNGKKITYIEQIKLNGTAGAVALAKDIIEKDEKFMVIMGDDFYKKSDLEKLLKYDYSVLALHAKEAEKFGLLDADSENRLLSILEKPHGKEEGYVNTAAYVINSKYFNTKLVSISETEFGLPQTLVKMSVDENTTVKVVEADTWFAVGDPEAYEISQEKYKEFLG